MKKIILWILLILLIIFCITISIIKFYPKLVTNDKNEKWIKNGITYESYWAEYYDKNESIYAKHVLLTYYLKIENNKISICTRDFDICNNYYFNKEDKKYTLLDKNKQQLKYNFEIEDFDERQIKITFVGGEENSKYIFYFSNT